ncbi:maltose regulon regulatory protein MalI [Klebsiella pneumoniae subsp. ozaenae]|uniref:Maltose regulon regulatory protein MalI n=1 Tax=Klebsiella pneumoniae subsp. ozaenae TaxID=574 RepID=A0A378B1J1_KLEPO|nr:maltose regulon regulatory protein MalI [Klebsiella pneumoniae subsp. ozaenae]
MLKLTAGLTDALERQGKMVFLTQGGRSGEKMAQRFDTLAAQGVDGVIIAGAIDRGSELRERAAEAGGCRWCLLPAPAILTMST